MQCIKQFFMLFCLFHFDFFLARLFLVLSMVLKSYAPVASVTSRQAHLSNQCFFVVDCIYSWLTPTAD